MADDYMERWMCPACGRPMHRWVTKGKYIDTTTRWLHDDDNTTQCRVEAADE